MEVRIQGRDSRNEESKVCGFYTSFSGFHFVYGLYMLFISMNQYSVHQFLIMIFSYIVHGSVYILEGWSLCLGLVYKKSYMHFNICFNHAGTNTHILLLSFACLYELINWSL